ncbi:MAG TPA: hypothetical protein PLG15_02295 [Candidatus Gastranaerophilaceae bacterium]|nr:hypothetical protein [Candidatus Gastranaerophilaceae bacterium]HPT41193.1 hypothetical protein [Candidatus Gastranaerophilaceae bacterium]
MKSGKKRLHLDGKKRVTLGKLISKDTTFFEVEKKSDGTLILKPQSALNNDEAWIYKDKKTFKNLKKSLLSLKKALITKIDNDFWDGMNELKDLKYTNEFLKNLEPIISKNNSKLFEGIKGSLKKIISNNAQKLTLKNLKTHENKEVLLTSLEGKEADYKIFWTTKNSQIIVINLIKKT